MKPRTPGFTPGRLTLAREAAGLSKADLAPLLGRTPTAVGQYESGIRTPGPDVLKLMSTHLGQPHAFFLRPEPPQRSGPIFYRSMRPTEDEARLKARAKLTYLWETLDHIQQLVTLPPVNMPKVGVLPSKPQDISEAMIDAVVMKARNHWNMGELPAPNIVWLLEESGAVVLRLDLNNDRLESLSYWRKEDGRPYIVLNATRQNAFRSRADVAHELGHLLLHGAVSAEHMADRNTFKLMEDQAKYFAQAFLLPEGPFLSDAYTLSLDVLLSLKPKWKVSVDFMLQRIRDLEIIGPDKYSNYRKYLAGRGWLKGEPYDADTKPEQPLLLRRLVDYLRTHKRYGPEQLSSALSLNPADLEELLQVEPGAFTNQPSPNILFTPKQRVG